MIPILLTTVALSVPLPQIERGESPVDGDWEVVSIQTGDVTLAPASLGWQLWFQFKKGSGTFSSTGPDRIEVTFRTNVTRKPAEVDITPLSGPEKDKTSLGIFERKGDELTLCMRQPGNGRPKKFTAEEKPKTFIVRLKKATKSHK